VAYGRRRPRGLCRAGLASAASAIPFFKDEFRSGKKTFRKPPRIGAMAGQLLPGVSGDNEKPVRPFYKAGFKVVSEKPDAVFHLRFLRFSVSGGFPGTGDYFPLAYEHTGEHQDKTRYGPPSQRLRKEQNPAQGGKAPFQAEDNGGVRRRRVPLGHYLKGIGYAYRSKASVKDGNDRVGYMAQGNSAGQKAGSKGGERFPRKQAGRQELRRQYLHPAAQERFYPKGGGQGAGAADGELARRKNDGVRLLYQPVDKKHVESPEHGAYGGDRVSGVNAVQAAGGAYKIQPRYGKERPYPGGRPGFSSQKYPQDGGKDHVKAGNESGVSRRGEHDPQLLKGNGDEKTASRQQRGGSGIFCVP
jgi:hypothetical protein